MRKAHVHKYIRMKTKENYFRCLDPVCSHNDHKENLVGRLSRCYKCDAEFTLSRNKLKLKYPKCDLCSKSKNKLKLSDALKELLRTNKNAIEYKSEPDRSESEIT